jgi:hypothetical protein
MVLVRLDGDGPLQIGLRARLVQLGQADEDEGEKRATSLPIRAKLELPTTPRRWFGEQTRLWQTERLSLDTEHYLRESELPGLHRDPFDRLLVAQAIERDLSIATPDPAIRAYPVAVVG